MSTLQDRITELMVAMSWSVGDVARVAGVTSSAVSQWLGAGKSTRRIASISTAVKLQNASGYSALWIADGEGEKRLKVATAAQPGQAPTHTAAEPTATYAAWPVAGMSLEQIQAALTPEQRGEVAGMIRALMSMNAKAQPQQTASAWPAAPQSTLLTGT